VIGASWSPNLLLESIRTGYSASELDKCTAMLKEFLATAHFDQAVTDADDEDPIRISIIMPSFNQARFIERSILSVLNQNYPNLQFIIMDGGSTDGTLNILRNYEKYLFWRSEPDRGQSDALNKALRLADGELVGWQNSDDVYFPNAFHRINRLARSRPHAVLYSGTVANIDGDDRVVRLGKFIRPSVLRLLYEGVVMSSQGVFWRREVHTRVGMYDPELHHAMDMEFWIRVLAEGGAEFLPQILGGFRAHEGTKTAIAKDRRSLEPEMIRKNYSVDQQSLKWRIMRSALRVSRLIQWTLVTRPRCMPILEEI
jgi:glycosyltransferase involved in cell wall biosynthesis